MCDTLCTLTERGHLQRPALEPAVPDASAGTGDPSRSCPSMHHSVLPQRQSTSEWGNSTLRNNFHAGADDDSCHDGRVYGKSWGEMIEVKLTVSTVPEIARHFRSLVVCILSSKSGAPNQLYVADFNAEL